MITATTASGVFGCDMIEFHHFPRSALLAKTFFPMNPPGNSIVLVGFMGAGKSSVGRTLARMTGLPRFDTDEMIAKRLKLTVSEIFETHGEKLFREAETETLRALRDQAAAIIVTGGGIVLAPQNREFVRE